MNEFLEALSATVAATERLIVCGFVGDPDKTEISAWRPRPWNRGREFPLSPQANAYVTVASFTQAADGTWRRRGDTFAAGHALMIDDLGTKVPLDIIAPLPPTAMIETSPGNFQAWYMFKEALRDRGKFDAIIRAFIANKLLGADPGMAGVTRVGRVPGFVNAKRKYLSEHGLPWKVRVQSLDGERRYSPDEIVAAFGLRLLGTTEPRERLVPTDAADRIATFLSHYKWLKAHGVLKREEPDLSGWIQITCPWVDGHTGGADTGAAICEPNAENGWHGGFKCWHGHDINKGWQDLTDWILEQTVEELERANTQGQQA